MLAVERVTPGCFLVGGSNALPLRGGELAVHEALGVAEGEEGPAHRRRGCQGGTIVITRHFAHPFHGYRGFLAVFQEGSPPFPSNAIREITALPTTSPSATESAGLGHF